MPRLLESVCHWRNQWEFDSLDNHGHGAGVFEVTAAGRARAMAKSSFVDFLTSDNANLDSTPTVASQSSSLKQIEPLEEQDPDGVSWPSALQVPSDIQEHHRLPTPEMLLRYLQHMESAGHGPVGPHVHHRLPVIGAEGHGGLHQHVPAHAEPAPHPIRARVIRIERVHLPPPPPAPVPPPTGPGLQPGDGDLEDAAESGQQSGQHIKPVVLLGGVLAVLAHAYLWGNVFSTLFKSQRPASAQQPSQVPSASLVPESAAAAETSPAAGAN
mmetsp:Transcript_73984/g.176087  ORF Transcript_73984/g.176087 Transcript_73984/m.176087 type:complete len:270 (-) Transcript_73984:50-859(-)